MIFLGRWLERTSCSTAVVTLTQDHSLKKLYNENFEIMEHIPSHLTTIWMNDMRDSYHVWSDVIHDVGLQLLNLEHDCAD